MSDITISQDKSPWYQWDTGLTVTVSGGTMTECHFANRKQGTAYVQAVIKGKAKVPDELLQVAAPITAYGYIPDGAGGQTYIEQVFEVTARNIPADYTYTKTAQKTIRDAEQACDQAFAAVNYVHDVADQVVGLKNDAKASADAAKKSADSAEYQKGEAKKYADDAGVAFANAQSKAKMSSVHATESKNSAAKSEAAATKAAQSASEVLAATKANADAAAKSATDAATAKAGAETAASNAATSAGAAADSAAAAAKSAGDAAASVDAINVIAPKTVGVPAVSSDQFDIAIGQNAKTAANQSIAIGVTSDAAHLASIALGSFAKTSKDYELAIGNLAENGADITREITHVSTPTAPTSASTKKYTDDNDAKTLTDAKKYTDDNTTNALIGKVSGKLLHVDDAWPGKPLGLTIDGAYKQDGTPSPDNHVPITVIENPALKVIGSNFIDPDKMALTGTYYKKLNGELRIVSIDGRAWSTLPVYGVLPAGTYVIGGDSCEIRKALDDTVIVFTQTTKISFTLQVATEVKIKVGFGNPNNQYPYVSHCVIAMVNSGSVIYAPYVGTELPITLPAEHPYLAALPNGTHDEIVIDKSGNVNLVANVLQITVPTAEWVIQEQTGGFSLGYINTFPGSNIIRKNLYSSALVSDKFESADVWENRPCFGISEVLWVVPKTNQNNITPDDVAAAATGMKFYAPLVTPITYHLGKLDIPVLPETISNVWTDAELTTNMSMTYKQDVNTVIAGLKSQIAALTSKAANDAARTSEPTIESDPDYSTGEPTIE